MSRPASYAELHLLNAKTLLTTTPKLILRWTLNPSVSPSNSFTLQPPKPDHLNANSFSMPNPPSIPNTGTQSMASTSLLKPPAPSLARSNPLITPSPQNSSPQITCPTNSYFNKTLNPQPYNNTKLILPPPTRPSPNRSPGPLKLSRIPLISKRSPPPSKPHSPRILSHPNRNQSANSISKHMSTPSPPKTLTPPNLHATPRCVQLPLSLLLLTALLP